MNRTIIAVSGFSSNVGKTTLMCDLLRVFPGWEAIKITRGHYRSCGKDPHACCVSHLLSDQPLIRSGRQETFAVGKDTGRYWDAGASNVHWLIVTNEQVEEGIRQALERVTAPGVLIEGTSFLKFVEVDFALMVARSAGGQIKSSARRALSETDALYLFDAVDGATARASFREFAETSSCSEQLRKLPLYTRGDFPQLVARLKQIHSSLAA